MPDALLEHRMFALETVGLFRTHYTEGVFASEKGVLAWQTGVLLPIRRAWSRERLEEDERAVIRGAWLRPSRAPSPTLALLHI